MDMKLTDIEFDKLVIDFDNLEDGFVERQNIEDLIINNITELREKEYRCDNIKLVLKEAADVKNFGFGYDGCFDRIMSCEDIVDFKFYQGNELVKKICAPWCNDNSDELYNICQQSDIVNGNLEIIISRR